jgi:hypothetical protein
VVQFSGKTLLGVLANQPPIVLQRNLTGELSMKSPLTTSPSLETPVCALGDEPAGRPIPRDDDALLYPLEAAYLLGLSLRTLEQWRWRGCGLRYCAIGVGRRASIRYRRRDIIAFQDAALRRSTSDSGEAA